MLRNPNAPYGGLLSLMALKGRGGDTELVHMSQPQVARLQALGTLSQNPATGLPEARPTAPVSVLSRADGGPLLPREKPYTSNPQGGPPREVIDDPDFKEEMDRATYVDPLIDYDPKRMGITPSDKWAILGTYVADIDKLSPFNKEEYLNFFRKTDAPTLVSDKNNRKDIMGISQVRPENKDTVLETVKHEGRHRGINNLSIDLGEPLKFIFTDKNNKVTKSLVTDEETVNRLQDWMNFNKKEQKRNLDFFNEVFPTYNNNKFTKEDIQEILKHPKFLNQIMYINQQAQMSRARDIDEGINERGQAWTHYPKNVKRPKTEVVLIQRAGGGNMSSDADEADIPRIDRYSEPDLVETSPSGARVKYGKILPVRLEDPVDFRDANILRRLQEGMSEIVERSVPPEARDSVSLVHSYVNPLMWVPDPENLYDKAALVKKGIKENDEEALTEGLIGLGEDAFSILGAGAGVKALKSAKGAVKRTANKMKRAEGGVLHGDQYHEGMVDGKGDGQSDHVPFKVEGGDTPMALLSRDEYVLPADVVAMIGSGSSNAGAERLDKFVKSVRKESYGTTKQMPAMKDGGITALLGGGDVMKRASGGKLSPSEFIRKFFNKEPAQLTPQEQQQAATALQQGMNSGAVYGVSNVGGGPPEDSSQLSRFYQDVNAQTREYGRGLDATPSGPSFSPTTGTPAYANDAVLQLGDDLGRQQGLVSETMNREALGSRLGSVGDYLGRTGGVLAGIGVNAAFGPLASGILGAYNAIANTANTAQNAREMSKQGYDLNLGQWLGSVLGFNSYGSRSLAEAMNQAMSTEHGRDVYSGSPEKSTPEANRGYTFDAMTGPSAGTPMGIGIGPRGDVSVEALGDISRDRDASAETSRGGTSYDGSNEGGLGYMKRGGLAGLIKR